MLFSFWWCKKIVAHNNSLSLFSSKPKLLFSSKDGTEPNLLFIIPCWELRPTVQCSSSSCGIPLPLSIFKVDIKQCRHEKMMYVICTFKYNVVTQSAQSLGVFFLFCLANLFKWRLMAFVFVCVRLSNNPIVFLIIKLLFVRMNFWKSNNTNIFFFQIQFMTGQIKEDYANTSGDQNRFEDSIVLVRV